VNNKFKRKEKEKKKCGRGKNILNKKIKTSEIKENRKKGRYAKW